MEVKESERVSEMEFGKLFKERELDKAHLGGETKETLFKVFKIDHRLLF